jgi:hypothetical protein
MATSLQLVLFCLAAVLGVTVAKQYDWNWKEGRATFYGEHQGLPQLNPFTSELHPRFARTDAPRVQHSLQKVPTSMLPTGTDAWSIHKGSCDYGYIWNNEPLGWDVAAMTDYHPDYPESCG